MLRKILAWIVALAVALVGGAYLLPRHVHVEREVLVGRPPAAVFPLINSLHRFNEWSPWSGLDPTMKLLYTGPEAGVGAHMAWAGNSKVGSGNETIVESVPEQRVTTALDFGAQGAAQASLLLTPAGAGTRVVWTLEMDLGMSPVGRYFGLFMDHLIGPDYERGLQRLRALAESVPNDADSLARRPSP
ncbi:MAG: SRPBCC family protein [Pseudomonadota bacterium]